MVIENHGRKLPGHKIAPKAHKISASLHLPKSGECLELAELELPISYYFSSHFRHDATTLSCASELNFPVVQHGGIKDDEHGPCIMHDGTCSADKNNGYKTQGISFSHGCG